MLIIPVQAAPNQTLSVLLGGQNCQISLFTRNGLKLYASLTINNTKSIINNVICQNINRLVRYPYLGFVGDLWFFDTQFTVDSNMFISGSDPVYTGLGSRFLLQYIEAADLAAAEAA